MQNKKLSYFKCTEKIKPMQPPLFNRHEELLATNQTSITAATFFESYCMAFNRQDAAAIAEHYAFPMLSTIDTGKIVVTPVASKVDLVSQLERLLDMYRAIGFVSARILKISVLEFSPRLTQVSVEWELCGASGKVLYIFQAAYTVSLSEDALRITGVAHNEILHYRECLARVQSRINS